MKTLCNVLLITCLTLSTAHAALREVTDAEILAQIAAGKMLCAKPDHAAKTCESISQLRHMGDGTVTEATVSAIASNPLVVTRGTSTGLIKNGFYCGMLTPDNINAMQVEVNGAAAPPEAAQQMRLAMMPMANQQICAKLFEDAQGLQSQYYINQKRSPEVDSRVSWIDPKAGYRLAKAQ